MAVIVAIVQGELSKAEVIVHNRQQYNHKNDTARHSQRAVSSERLRETNLKVFCLHSARITGAIGRHAAVRAV